MFCIAKYNYLFKEGFSHRDANGRTPGPRERTTVFFHRNGYAKDRRILPKGSLWETTLPFLLRQVSLSLQK